MQRLRVLSIITAALLLAAGGAPMSQDAPPQVVRPGEPFSPMSLQVLQPGGAELQALDLKPLLGKKPIVFVYFVLGEAVSEEVFLGLQELAASGMKGDVAVFGAIKPGRKFTLEQAAERLSLFGASIPVIVEDELNLGRALGIATAPSLSLIDHRGVLRITDARSLKQQIGSSMTMEQAIVNASRRGPVPTVPRLPRYYPANELVGEQFPDFALKKLKSKDKVRLSDIAGRQDRVTALLFWHPNCKHCKRAMPAIVVGANSYHKWLDVVSVADLKNSDDVRNAEDTLRAHGVEFPVLVDEGRQVTNMYKVVSTPTMFFIGPDGIVNSVYTQSNINYVTVFSNRIRRILKVGREYESGG